MGRVIKYLITREDHLGGNVIGGDPGTFEPHVWKWLVERYRPRDVLDLGCGEGHAASYFRSLGCNAIGMDGVKRNAVQLTVPVVVWDLTAGPFLISNIDMIWCCEVVEHIKDQYVENVVKSLSCGRYIAMTHATTNDGYYHVNPQPSEYWISKMSDAGFDYLIDDTEESRRYGQGLFWKNTGLIFRRRSIYETDSGKCGVLSSSGEDKSLPADVPPEWDGPGYLWYGKEV